jgi:hypothetical protein
MQQRLGGTEAGMAATSSVGPRRRVYFLSGFDPRGGSHYFRLFADQLRQVAGHQRLPLQLKRLSSPAPALLSRWTIAGELSSPVELVFLHWDDLARQHWPRSPWRLLLDLLPIYRWYLLGGGLQRIARWSPSVALCGLYPCLVFTLALLLVSALAAWAGVGVLGLGGPAWAAGLAAVLVAAWGLWLGWRLAEQLGVVWLFRSIRFTHQLGQGRDQALRARVRTLAQQLCTLEDAAPAAELLLAGHSSGSFVMAMLAAELRRQPQWDGLLPRLRLLSLGQNLANLAVHAGAERFHQDLIELAAEPRPPWLDITSRDDYLCFAGVDPYRSCGLPAPSGGAYPQLRLIELARGRGIRSWWQLMGCQFDLHFDYLRCADRAVVGFNWWQLLLAPRLSEVWDG